jgi:hypothetical protein
VQSKESDKVCSFDKIIYGGKITHITSVIGTHVTNKYFTQHNIIWYKKALAIYIDFIYI